MLTTIAVTAFVGVVNVESAFGATTVTATPSTGLAHGDTVGVQISNFVVQPLATAAVAVCGNAYADGSPLPAPITITPGVIDPVNCEEIGFGAVPADPTTINVPALQRGIGTGNRSCVSTAPEPCFLYVNRKVNLPDDVADAKAIITFAADPTPEFSTTADTTTTVIPVGSPVAQGKIAYAHVKVTTEDDELRPEGLVTLYEGPTLIGSAVLGADATIDIPLGTPAIGSYPLEANFEGNGSFAASSDTTTMSIIGENNISVGDSTVVEGDTGTRLVVIPVVLSKPPTVPLTVTYTVAGSGGDPASIGWGTGFDASQPSKASTSKTLSFSTKQTVKYVSIKVAGDTSDENDETFSVTLSNVNEASGFELRKSSGEVTIVDDDATAKSGKVLSLGTAAVPEGDFGGSKALKFAFSLSEPATTDVTVFYHIEQVTAVHGNKVSGDWGGGITKKAVIRAGRVGKVFGVGTFPDLNHELDLTLRVEIDSAAGVTISPTHNSAIGTIYSDE